MVRAGQLRHTIRIERRSATPDGAGEPTYAWSLVAERRCGVERAPGQEVWASAGRNARVPTVFLLRYDDAIMRSFVIGETRAVFNGKFYNVTSCFDPDGMKVEMKITSVEEVEATS